MPRFYCWTPGCDDSEVDIEARDEHRAAQCYASWRGEKDIPDLIATADVCVRRQGQEWRFGVTMEVVRVFQATLKE